MSEPVHIQQLLITALEEIRQLRKIYEGKKPDHDPVIDSRYICSDLGISSNTFLLEIVPRMRPYLFRYADKGTWRCKISDYRTWKEAYISDLRTTRIEPLNMAGIR
jgi:hypothetical protein